MIKEAKRIFYDCFLRSNQLYLNTKGYHERRPPEDGLTYIYKKVTRELPKCPVPDGLYKVVFKSRIIIREKVDGKWHRHNQKEPLIVSDEDYTILKELVERDIV